MNIRKLLCKLFKKGKFFYRLFDCKRYEPPTLYWVCKQTGGIPVLCPEIVETTERPTQNCELHWEEIDACADTGLRPNPYCPDIEKRIIAKDEEVGTCELHKKPVVTPALDPAYDFYKTNRFLSPYFFVSGLINHAEISDADFQNIIDRCARENLANVLRFIPYGIWNPADVTSPLIHFPHPKIGGKYILDEINQAWEDQVLRRLWMVVRAGIIPQVDVFDNCQYHSPNPWYDHWLYEENNTGFNGHSTHWDSLVKTHFYEWCDFEPEWSQKYQQESDMTDKDRKDMLACRATKEYYAWFINRFIDKLNGEFGDRFIVGHNEIDGGDGFHSWAEYNIYAIRGIGRDRRVTSTDYLDWYWIYKDQFMNRFIPSVHGVENVYQFDDIIGQLKDNGVDISRLIISGDGYAWSPNDAELREVCKNAFKYCRGYERNAEFWFTSNWEELDWGGAEIMRQEFVHVL